MPSPTLYHRWRGGASDRNERSNTVSREDYETVVDAGAAAGRVIAEKFENSVDNLDDSLTMISDHLFSIATALEALVEAQRKPIRYEYHWISDAKIGHMGPGERVVQFETVEVDGYIATSLLVERPVYYEVPEGEAEA